MPGNLTMTKAIWLLSVVSFLTDRHESDINLLIKPNQQESLKPKQQGFTLVAKNTSRNSSIQMIRQETKQKVLQMAIKQLKQCVQMH